MTEKLLEDLEYIFDNTKHLLKEFSGKTIFVTGATGFFGKWLLESFIYANHIKNINIHIIALSRNPNQFLLNYPQFNHPEIQFLKGDILDLRFLILRSI